MAVTITTIIEQVRCRIDEQTALGSSDYPTSFMDNTIKACIPDAFKWVCLYANPTLLTGNNSSETSSAVKSYELPLSGTDADGLSYSNGVITLPYRYLKILRVRASSWQRSVAKTIAEDSDEYLMQSNDTSKADIMNPVVAEINSVPQKLELYPKPTGTSDKVYITIIMNPNIDLTNSTGSTSFDIPEKARSAFYYYLAYLVLIAYNDTGKAGAMLGAAKSALGISSTTAEK